MFPVKSPDVYRGAAIVGVCGAIFMQDEFGSECDAGAPPPPSPGTTVHEGIKFGTFVVNRSCTSCAAFTLGLAEQGPFSWALFRVKPLQRDFFRGSILFPVLPIEHLATTRPRRMVAWFTSTYDVTHYCKVFTVASYV